MEIVFSFDTLAATLRMAAPLTLVGLAGLISLQTGDLNIALEGMMLVGAFFAVLGSYLFESALVGVLFAVTAAMLLASVFAFFVINLRSDVFVVGIALNILASGLTIFLLRFLFQVRGSFSSPRIVALPRFNVPFLEQIPGLGTVLNNHSFFVYFSWILVGVFWLVIYRTRLGLYLRAAGEHPKALKTAGVSVRRIRWIASFVCGALCGLAGAHLSLGYLLLFVENMSAGRGFIALAVVIFGGTNPLGVWFASLLFGLAEGISLRTQNLGIPSEFMLMLPYLTTLVALVLRSGRKRYARRFVAQESSLSA